MNHPWEADYFQEEAPGSPWGHFEERNGEMRFFPSWTTNYGSATEITPLDPPLAVPDLRQRRGLRLPPFSDAIRTPEQILGRPVQIPRDIVNGIVLPSDLILPPRDQRRNDENETEVDEEAGDDGSQAEGTIHVDYEAQSGNEADDDDATQVGNTLRVDVAPLEDFLAKEENEAEDLGTIHVRSSSHNGSQSQKDNLTKAHHTETRTPKLVHLRTRSKALQAHNHQATVSHVKAAQDSPSQPKSKREATDQLMSNGTQSKRVTRSFSRKQTGRRGPVTNCEKCGKPMPPSRSF